MSKKLLEESTIRQFMKLAQLGPLTENFLSEELSPEEKKRVADEADKAAKPIEDAAKGTGKPVTEMEDSLYEDLSVLFEDDLNEMDMYEEEGDEMEMEVEEDDMEAEINITPDQARAIIAVADMLKDVMPDLEAPETEEEEEAEMDMEEPDMDMGAEEEAEGEEEVTAGEEEEEEALTEAVMRRVTARLKRLKNK
jgi:hypothetical protein